MLKVLPFILVVALVIYTVADIANSEEDERLGVPQILWILLVIVIPVLGCIAWFAVSRSRRAQRAAGASVTGRGTATAAPAQRTDRPLAPDDDPEFLWLLEQARLKKEREQRAAQEAEGTDGPADPPEGEAPRP